MKNLLIIIITTFFCLISNIVYSVELKLKCRTGGLLNNGDYTNFKFDKGFFGSKLMERVSGNWIDLSENPIVSDYKIGDLSANFVIKHNGLGNQMSLMFFNVVVDFETKQLEWKNCYDRQCSGEIIAKDIYNCN